MVTKVKRPCGWGSAKGTVVTVRLPDEVLEKMRVEAEADEVSVGLWLKDFLLRWALTEGSLPYQEEGFESDEANEYP